jgi:RND family efflux transporter MFP subunit
MKRIMLFARGVLPVAFLLAATQGCSRPGGREVSRSSSRAPVQVRAVRVESSGGGASIVLGARVRASEEVTISASVTGRLSALPVKEGGSFRLGAVLAKFDALEAREALRSAQGARAAAEVRRDQAVRQETRLDSLLAARVASVREQELAHADRLAADAQYRQALAAERQLEAGTSVLAPFDGVVVRKHLDAGSDVRPGTPLLDLRSLGAGEIEASVPESQLPGLPRRRAEFQTSGGLWQRAELVRVEGMTDPASRTRKAYFRPTSTAPTLTPGDFASIRLTPLEEPATSSALKEFTVGVGPSVLVPSESLVRRGSLTGIFILRDGRSWLRWLRTGREQSGSTEVLAGLQPGDWVASRPEGLEDGGQVKVGP